ncbi:TPA: hypothetical protein ACKFUI_003814 [Citrobacter koseri]|uniref:hypothetical protein n=1 Tax=Citrobacter koseri TaxID=545 RepID=UPI001D414525|nr:hypothetical protein [Citrobacter koseri]MDT7493840.1 hypothetical protein [Citrobacter koseri]CAG0231240.1 hypothetical protein AN2351V1_1032 [Citrobacter koseri]CAH5988471.1 hypothetical protein AN2351V1_1032 [Citrobacter koseri]
MKKTSLLIIYIIILTSIELLLIYIQNPSHFIIVTLLSIIGYVSIFIRNNWIKLNEGNLLKQPLFIASILIPLHTFLIYGLWIWKDHSLDFTASGFNNFLEISKLPLLLLASAVPLAAIVNNIHRTIQVEKQITETSRKNYTDSYYTHLKFVTDSFEKYTSIEFECGDYKSKSKVSNPLSLYHSLFTASNSDNGASNEINKSLCDFISNTWQEINFHIDSYRLHFGSLLDADSVELREQLARDIHDIEIKIISIFKKLFITGYHYNKMAVYRWTGGGIQTSFMNHGDMIKKISLCETICSFIFEIINSNDELVRKHINNGFIDQNSFTAVKFFDFNNKLIKSLEIPHKDPEFFKDR